MHGPMITVNASAIQQLLDQMLTKKNKFAMDAPLTNGTNLPATASFATIKNVQTTHNLEYHSSGTPTAASANVSHGRSAMQVTTSTSNHATAFLFELSVFSLIAPSLKIRKNAFISIH